MTMHPRNQFPRTVCACTKCQTACTTMPGMLAPGDLDRIAEALGKTVPMILNRFCASPGAIIGRMTRDGPSMFRIPTIVPAQDETGRCVFLDSDNRCRIHAVAPYGCSHFDWHMPREVADPRSAACLRAIMADPAYQAAWHYLKSRGWTAEAPEEKRRKLEEANR